ncbi:hypothetical protein [Marivita sp. S2033]|uniref:hypothetical protein n=1 Tax=Marivita sp. S2033 TaxID=3373187 RepID=UPI0039827F23
MPDVNPVLSVTVRRFRADYKTDIETSLHRLQDAAARHRGYLGEQNSLSQSGDLCELVTVFAFDSRVSRESWERSEARAETLAELDKFPQEMTKHTQFDELAALIEPKSRVSKIEIVLILIFWIVLNSTILDFIATFLLPQTIPALVEKTLLIAVNVALISYVLLPWSSRLLSRLKEWIQRK